MSRETEPGDLDPLPHRRRGELRLESLANNALLKLAQFVLTGIAMPAIAFGINAIFQRMESLEKQFIAQDKANATAELRLISTERSVSELLAANQALRERVLSLEFQSRVNPKGP